MSSQFPVKNFNSNELFKPIAQLKNDPRFKFNHGTAIFLNDHLLLPISKGQRDGGFHVFDIQQPSQPMYVTTYNNSEIREGHSIGLSRRSNKIIVAALASFGIKFLDVSNLRAINEVKYLRLPEVLDSDYDHGAWWLHWAGRYLYVGAASKGLYIIDTADINNPKIVKRMTTNTTGGFRVGSVNVLGDLMTLTGNDVNGLSIFDLSNPINPVLKKNINDVRAYASTLNADKLYLATVDTPHHGLVVYDSNTAQRLGAFRTGARGGYVMVEDNYAHLGASDHYFKIDVSNPANPQERGRVSRQDAFSTGGKTDLDFVAPMGNLVILSDDDAGLQDGDGFGSVIVPHQSSADGSPLKVNSIKLAKQTNSIFGVSFNKALDFSTVNENTVYIREKQSGNKVASYLSYQSSLVNLTPVQALSISTDYELVIESSIRDLSGNSLLQSRRELVDFDGVVNGGGNETENLNCQIKAPSNFVPNKLIVLKAVNCNAENLMYSWDFGDGSSQGYKSSAFASHSYSAGGRFVVELKVQRNGRVYTFNHLLNLESGFFLSKKAKRSRTMALDEERKLIWVLNSDNQTVTLVDENTHRKIKELKIGQEPSAIALDAEGNAWVTLQNEDRVVVIDSSTHIVRQSFELGFGTAPSSIVYSEKNNKFYLATKGSGEIIELSQSGVLRRKFISKDLRSLSLDAQNEYLYLPRFYSRDSKALLFRVSVQDFDIFKNLELAMDPGQDSEASGRGLANYLFVASISPDAKELVIVSKKDNIQRGLLRDGQKLNFENTVRAIVSVVDLESFTERLDKRLDLNDRSLASDAEFDEEGRFLFVSTLGSNMVDVIDWQRNEVLSSIETVGSAPRALIYNSETKKLYIDNFLDRDLAVYDMSTLGVENSFKKIASLRKVKSELLTIRELLGKKIFYDASDLRMSRDSYLSCASCHFDGEEDGQVWDFTEKGEGLRNTTSLKTLGLFEKNLFHWTANFNEIQDFENDIRSGFGGLGFLSQAQFNGDNRFQTLGPAKAGVSAELDALSSYVLSLKDVPKSPYADKDGSMTLLASRGEQVFRQMNCNSCHFGESLSDSHLGLRHDVGTLDSSSGQRMSRELDGLDTPSLKGLWATAPYLHNGKAKSLKDVFTLYNERQLHGATRLLSEGDLLALVEYLNHL